MKQIRGILCKYVAVGSAKTEAVTRLLYIPHIIKTELTINSHL